MPSKTKTSAPTPESKPQEKPQVQVATPEKVPEKVEEKVEEKVAPKPKPKPQAVTQAKVIKAVQSMMRATQEEPEKPTKTLSKEDQAWARAREIARARVAQDASLCFDEEMMREEGKMIKAGLVTDLLAPFD
jgi:hypothetical protein